MASNQQKTSSIRTPVFTINRETYMYSVSFHLPVDQNEVARNLLRRIMSVARKVDIQQANVVDLDRTLEDIYTYAYNCLHAGLFCDGTRQYGVPAPFFQVKKLVYL